MNILNLVSRWSILGAIGALIVLSVPNPGWAQDTTTTSVQPGNPTMETSVRNAKVVYVEGNNLVLRLESGRIEHVVVPDNEVFTIGGQDVSVRDLQPGTTLTQTFTTTTTPHYVNTVRIIKGRVWHVSAPTSVIVSLPSGGNQVFTVPSHAKFLINGEKRTVHDLRKGMSIEATIVTDDMHTVVSQSKTNVGQAPPPPLPALVGVLLFRPAPVALQPDPEPVASVTAEHAWAQARLPQTGSVLPLFGLIGLLSLAAALAFRVARKSGI